MKKLVILFLGFLSLQTFAVGHVKSAKIIQLYCGYPESYEMCGVTFDQDITDKDSCHTTPANQMQFKVNTDIGKALLSVALSAHATQKNVNVYSTGSCSIYPGLADVKWITIKN